MLAIYYLVLLSNKFKSDLFSASFNEKFIVIDFCFKVQRKNVEDFSEYKVGMCIELTTPMRFL